MSRGIVVALALCACGRVGFDPGSDSSLGDGQTVTADAGPCLGTAHLLVDNFDDNTLDPAKWGKAYEGATARHVEVGGRLELRLGAASSFDYAGYVSTNLYDYKDDRVFVEVVTASSQPEGAMLLLLGTTVDHTDGPSVEWEAGAVIMRVRIGDVIHDRATVPYDPVLHRWWQIRERAGRTYWETSRDGVTWTTHHDEPTAATTQALVTLAAGYDAMAAAQADTVRFDNLNGGGAPPLCP